jgi:hypothetical protein
LIVISLSLISCTQQSKLEKFVEKREKNRLNDDESFELVSLKTENKEVVNFFCLKKIKKK